MAINIVHGLRERAFNRSHGVREGGWGSGVEELFRNGDGFRSGFGAPLQEYSEQTEVAFEISRRKLVVVEVAQIIKI